MEVSSIIIVFLELCNHVVGITYIWGLISDDSKGLFASFYIRWPQAVEEDVFLRWLPSYRSGYVERIPGASGGTSRSPSVRSLQYMRVRTKVKVRSLKPWLNIKKM